MDPPAPGERVDDVESEAVDAVALAKDPLEPVSLVDHLDQQTVVV
ncbi:MAG TPA: hypothetical protein VLP43_09515 [Solirubrobacteraceae bacterium]|nr:hypothetical protein [Solirubrobacteraceae bacterium]